MHFILLQSYHMPIKELRCHKDQTWAECVGLGVWHEGMWGVKRRATLQWHARRAVGICDRGQQGSRVMCKDYAPQILYSTLLVLNNSAKMNGLANSTYRAWMWRTEGSFMYTARRYWTKVLTQYGKSQNRKQSHTCKTLVHHIKRKHGPMVCSLPATLSERCHTHHHIPVIETIESFLAPRITRLTFSHSHLIFQLVCTLNPSYLHFPFLPSSSSPEFVPEEVGVSPFVFHDGPVVVTVCDGIWGDAVLPHLT